MLFIALITLLVFTFWDAGYCKMFSNFSGRRLRVIVLLLGVMSVLLLAHAQFSTAFTGVNITSVTVTGQSAQYTVSIRVTGNLSPHSMDYACGMWACDEGDWQLRNGAAVITAASAGYYQSGSYSHTFSGVNFTNVTQGCFVDTGIGGGASGCRGITFSDNDSDGWLNAYDNCPNAANADQADSDGNGTGDVCQDSDGDGIIDPSDNCPMIANSDQANNDSDAQGDVCDTDDDNDTVPDASDNCPVTPNLDQANHYGGTAGDVCEDSDSDTLLDISDNCPTVANSDQANTDGDAQGDACDPDDDDDSILDGDDNCPLTVNVDQADSDGDGLGDVCDSLQDNDGDGIANDVDNCMYTPNADQADADDNGIGDVCQADGRLNPDLGDYLLVVYHRIDADGEPFYAFWLSNGDGTASFLFNVTRADFAPYDTQMPTGPVTVYTYAPNSIKIMLAPDGTLVITMPIESGKTWILVLNEAMQDETMKPDGMTFFEL